MRASRLLTRAPALLALALLAAPGWAARISGVSLQGEVGSPAQLRVSFDAPVVRLGAAGAPAPVALDCTGGALRGDGRWADERTWIVDFREPPPPGLRCEVRAVEGWQGLDGPLQGRRAFTFSTGGPAVVQAQPWPGSTIEEDQHFVLQLNGPVPEAQAAARAHCELDGVGERVPVRVVGGTAREALLRAQRLQREAARTVVLACARPLPSQARLRLVWNSAPDLPGSTPAAVPATLQRLDYAVRPAFAAEFSCERERAQAPCMPLRPLVVAFSAPVPRAQAAAVRLEPLGPATGGKAPAAAALAPVFDKDDRATEVESLRFAAPLPELARYRVVLPPDLRDASGRPLANARSFPLEVATAQAPPLAKFAAAPFGVVEWGPQAAVPVTLRRVQADLGPGAAGGQVRIRRVEGEAEVLRWFHRLQRHHETQLSARDLGRPEAEWHVWQENTDARGRKQRQRVERMIATREVSLLAGDAQARRLALPPPAAGDARAAEVVGIPITEPGYHVIEIESRRLGQALLAQAAPMYVRTGVLVTNLGVHFKHGRDGSAVWVTTLDRARPVAGAEVAVHDCAGTQLWQGRTDAQGLARVDGALSARAASCGGEDGLFVTARQRDAQGRVDMAFVFSGWMRGIEPWRFAVPASPPAWAPPEPDARVHTVFDRTLLRAGETVSMKHFVRLQTSAGFALPERTRLPTRLKLIHVGSGDEHEQALDWPEARSAVSIWTIPAGARLGAWRVELERPGAGPQDPPRRWAAGEFRVEEFRVPLVDARLSGPRAAVVAPRELALDAQLRHLNGGGVAQAPLRATALLRPRVPRFAGHEDFSFEPPRDAQPRRDAAAEEDGDTPAAAGRLVADGLRTQTSREGAARIVLKNLPPLEGPGEIVTELSFTDPNGEIQTVAATTPVWPAAVVASIQARQWVASRGRARFTALALDTEGRPLPGQALEVRGVLRQDISARKRLVGGFYAWENHVERRELGVLCRGRADARGRLECDAALDTAGQVELIVSTQDKSGHRSQAAASLWITGAGELWFAQDEDDRIELLPEKKRYQPGETARLQVRMPFRQATALVAVEREGVIRTQVVRLRGSDPVVEVPIEPGWAPNVYVSVLAVRGRLRDMSWRNAFGFDASEPLEWLRSLWHERRDYRPPTAMVDLAKPAFKLGVAALEVGTAQHELHVSVLPDKTRYAVRETARVRVRVTHAGQPARGAEVVFAAVDEGLLALRPNDSWSLLQAMMQPRDWGVATSTAQGEIIGRRHHGRKAVPAGGGGGRSDARELFDTLLLWQPRVRLDERGEALVEVPLNDALTAFRLVAVADAVEPPAPGRAPAPQRFGTGSASIRVAQDLQLIAGLPPAVREGDRFEALLTLRNTTDRAMTVRATLAGQALDAAGRAEALPALAPREQRIEPGTAAELRWPVEVPARATRLAWEAATEELPAVTTDQTASAQGASRGGALARDRLKVTQDVGPTVPVRTLQATLRQLDGALVWPMQVPDGALRTQSVADGGLALTLQPRLGRQLPGLRRWFETYPYTCLEQQASRAVGLGDAKLWASVVNQLPAHLDADGLAAWFPPRPEEAARGSDRLTAYLLTLADEAGLPWPQALRERMLDGLTAFVEGRIERDTWSPRPDTDARRLAAIEALARHGRARARMLDTLGTAPAQWTTASLLDAWSLLKRLQGVPDREQRLQEVQRLLRARLAGSPGALRMQAGDEAWWWLMDSADANAARLLLAAADEPAWREDAPRLLAGHLERQQRGAWSTTTANAWSALALERFTARFEAVAVGGRTTATVAPGDARPAAQGPGVGTPTALDWARQPDGATITLPWPAEAATLRLAHDGPGRPWVLLQARAAVPLKAPLRAGYAVTRSLAAVQRQDPARWTRGDIVRVRLEIDAASDRNWVVVDDPIPAGATVLGTGLGRDSALATRGERRAGSAWPAFEERAATAFRSYFEVMPRGRHVVEYTLRLNHAGRFGLPPTRVEAMYAPETQGEQPNAVWEVAP